jgi:endoglycosylceramidase
MTRTGRVGRAALVAVALLAAGCSSGSDGGGSGDGADGAPKRPEDPIGELGPLAVARSGRPRIVDDQGRVVILRGANLNALGDYHAADPDLPPTRPPVDADWDEMAANGFSVVRLVVSWSKLEPERGSLDQAYVARIEAAVRAAEERGIYTVIDLHQDAWGKFVATPKGTVCPPEVEAAIGWDGAPEWATLTDGATTCRSKGSRESAPAVQAAFRNFYANTDGIRDAFVSTVGRLAGQFAGDPAVAGYDLFNEPNKVLPDAESEAAYTELATDLVTEVRRVEAQNKGFAHLLFLEPIVLFPLPGTMPAEGFTKDRDIVFAPHNYAESITGILTVEQTWDVSAQTAKDRGWPLWIGEYGVWSTDDEALDVLTRFAAAEDEHLAGSAEWQWRQRCGDPHSIGNPGTVPEGRQVHLNLIDCPADRDAGPNRDFLEIVGRAYVRAAPGEITEVRSDPATGRFELEGRAGTEREATVVVWVPGKVRRIKTTGLDEPTIRSVDGGFYVVGTPKADRYTVTLGPR